MPKKQTALLGDFEVKRDRIAHETLHKNVTNLSGVPSWMLSVLTRVMELSGKEHLEDVWPNIEVFFHGGVAFTPYREQYRRLITSPRMHYMETYNASEGFFGLQSNPADPAMLLMLDYGVFYEFIPMDEFGKENPTVLPLEGVSAGVNYAMVISTPCGLWRYIIGDTVKFTSVNPYKFVITGRTKELHQRIRRRTHRRQRRAGPGRGLPQDRSRGQRVHSRPRVHGRRRQVPPPVAHRVRQRAGRHGRLRCGARQEIAGSKQRLRGKAVQGHHPAAPRSGESPPGLFNDWLKSKGKLGGQHKVPRLNNNRDIMEQLLRFNTRKDEN